ncbi:hypothetical protein TorRG33x02_239760 [Trema orientale]|uniref:Uncharacterized protein n=1 Tax=Trema orientale TaxID=63057 RepID=A0A2P5DWE4_TREOI|nr:hypothetical protein TorRG33x02_239760 [Trema orientale]
MDKKDPKLISSKTSEPMKSFQARRKSYNKSPPRRATTTHHDDDGHVHLLHNHHINTHADPIISTEDKIISPEQMARVAMTKYRFAELILKAKKILEEASYKQACVRLASSTTTAEDDLLIKVDPENSNIVTQEPTVEKQLRATSSHCDYDGLMINNAKKRRHHQENKANHDHKLMTTKKRRRVRGIETRRKAHHDEDDRGEKRVKDEEKLLIK